MRRQLATEQEDIALNCTTGGLGWALEKNSSQKG